MIREIGICLLFDESDYGLYKIKLEIYLTFSGPDVWEIVEIEYKVLYTHPIDKTSKKNYTSNARI